jgi:glyoxylase-like metal-dependent hydrolase (beta-lactamase superfamily II)
MGASTAEIVAGGEPRDVISTRATTYGLTIAGEPRVDRALAVGLAHQAGPFVVEAIALRGHTADGTAYRIRELDLLVVGDHLSAAEFPFASSTSEYRATLASLIDLLESDPPAHVVPGHGPSLTAVDALAIAREDLAYLRELRDAVVNAVDVGRLTHPDAIAVAPPRPAPDDLVEMHARNVAAQFAELVS